MRLNQNQNQNDEYEKHVAENTGDYQVHSKKAENIAAKVLCLLAAIVMWFYVVIYDTTTDEVVLGGINVTLRNVEQLEQELGLSVISGYGSTVDLTLRGAKSEIARLSADDVGAYADVRSITGAGEYSLDIKTVVPNGITIGGQSANFLTVYVDQRKTISVPVKVVFASMIIESNYYSMGTPVPNMETVNVTGPAAALDKIKYAQVSLDLGQVTKTLTATGKLELVDENGAVITNPYVKLQTSEVSVKVPVYTYKDIPLKVTYKYNYFNDGNVTVSITPSSIRVKGDPDELDAMDSIVIMQLDEKKIIGNTMQTTTIMLPDDIINVSGITTANVNVTHRGTETTDVVVNITVNNPNNLNYTLESDFINVRFRGTRTLLSMLNGNNATAVVDLGYLNNTSGKVSVPVTITLRDALAASVYEIGEYKVNVTINNES